jgi:hypothetical protein
MAVKSANTRIVGTGLPQPVRPTAGVPPASRAGYWIAILIALVGGSAWGLTAYGGLQEEIDSFTRVAVPGEAVVRIEEAGGHVIYYEGPGSPTLSELNVRVNAPGGTVVAVGTYGADLRYDAPDHGVGRAIGTFKASTAGRYEVIVGGIAPRGALVAVGDSIADSKLGSILGALLLVVVAGGAGLVLAVVTSIRRSRR